MQRPAHAESWRMLSRGLGLLLWEMETRLDAARCKLTASLHFQTTRRPWSSASHWASASPASSSWLSACPAMSASSSESRAVQEAAKPAPCGVEWVGISPLICQLAALSFNDRYLLSSYYVQGTETDRDPVSLGRHKMPGHPVTMAVFHSDPCAEGGMPGRGGEMLQGLFWMGRPVWAPLTRCLS